MFIPLGDNNRLRRLPVVTVLIATVNIAIYVWQLRFGLEDSVLQLGVIPFEISQLRELPPFDLIPIPFTLFSAIFLHGSVMHLAGNLLFLLIFGNDIEDAIGRGRFIVFYLLAGLFASIAHVLIDPLSVTPLVGASGAISGILGAYLLHRPGARIHGLTFFFFFFRTSLPAWLFLLLWFLIQLALSHEKTHIAWAAHLGGFAAGILLLILFRRRMGRIHG